ncbi:MAG: CDF family Co(II)/Ni(II) efflux transporter DmeF [Planctomycetes bacterium]|nr:CDF family Co(II)/Ni(II) efflux transporter DmeF [Planctomycetota bacterium]
MPDLGNDHGGAVRADASERRTRWVVGITIVMMVLELVVGNVTGSMALTADGWHMATHAGALGLALVGYWFARTRATHRAFSFGTGKVYALAGYTSAVALGVVALAMVWESGQRFFEPHAIEFDEALPVAVLGLLVNLGCVVLLGHGDHESSDDTAAGLDHDHAHGHGDDDGHGHGHDHDHGHEHGEHNDHDGGGARAPADHNMRAAYAHVLADAFTSVLAIGALVCGRWLGWKWMDPAMGIVGGAVILKWAGDLCRSAGRQLLDVSPAPELEHEIRAALEKIDDVRVADLHVWDLGPRRRGCIAAIVTATPRDTAIYRESILSHGNFSHVTVEVHRCRDPECSPT